jgi:Holliday junction resolvase RusA-like endonuclease
MLNELDERFVFFVRQKIPVKPLSVNHLSQVHKNRKTGKYVIGRNQKYKQYKKDVLTLLPPLKQDFSGELRLTLEFGFSNKLSDVDNAIKPVQDFLQTYYEFNDRQIHELCARKVIVKKGAEYFAFKIEQIT